MADLVTYPRPEGLAAPLRALKRAGERVGVVVHCPGSYPTIRDPQTEGEALQLLARIRRWHAAKKWADIGYHFGVWRDFVWELRDRAAVGAHAPPLNSSHYGVIVLHPSGVEADPVTLETLGALLDTLPSDVLPHNAVSARACPGPSITEWLRASGRWDGERR